MRKGGVLEASVSQIFLKGSIVKPFELEDFNYEYQWYRDGELLEGETGSSYRLGKADGGSKIKVAVLVTYKGGESDYYGLRGYRERESDVIEYLNAVLEGELLIRGEGVEGEVLFVDIDRLKDGDGLSESLFSYQWYRGGVAVEGAIYRSYLLEQEDVGERISVEVEVEDDEGHVEERRAELEGLVENVDNGVVGRVKILGTVHENERVTANIEGLFDVDGIDVGSYSYRWYRDGEEILGEVGGELLVEEGWLGSLILVKVNFMDLVGNEYELLSFSREVYGARIPKIISSELSVAEGEQGVIGILEVEFFGKGDLSYIVSGFNGSVVDINSLGEVSLLLVQDYELVESLDLVVTVRSEAGLETSRAIMIIIEDVDDEAPLDLRVLSRELVELVDIEVEEGSVEVLGILTADDADSAGEDLSYVIDDARFVIEETAAGSNTYVLKSSNLLDYEGVGVLDGTTMVEITVSDMAGNVLVEVFGITIGDVDDEYPMDLRLLDDVTGVELGDVVVEEGSVEVLGRFTVDDADTGDEGLSYVIDDDRFAIEEAVLGSNIYVLSSGNLLDYEGAGIGSDGTILLLVTVSDLGGNLLVESFTITVVDVDDEEPSNLRLLDDAGDELGSILAVEGNAEVLGTLFADDVDTASEDLTYTVNDNRFRVEMAGGDYVLSSGDLLDYEGVGVSRGGGGGGGTTIVEITISDLGDNRVVELLEVTVVDVDDESPMGLRLLDDMGDELGSIVVEEGSVRVLGTLAAEDVDTASGDLSYSINDMRFMIERTGGDYVLTATSLLDYEDLLRVNDDGVTQLQVTVSDGVPAHDYVSSFNITLEDKNDNVPVISVENLVSNAIDESLISATVIGTISVRDDDRTEINRRVVYTSENNRFSVDAITRKIYFSVFEISGRDLEVMTTLTASDGLNSSTINLSVTIDNTDDSQDVGISDQVLDIREGELEVPVAVIATGIDVIYSVTDTRFEIGVDTGVLRFKGST